MRDACQPCAEQTESERTRHGPVRPLTVHDGILA
jgi:hypothetical protein